MLEEMDSEFGIGSLIEEEFGTAKKRVCCAQIYLTVMAFITIYFSLLFLTNENINAFPHLQNDLKVPAH